MEFTTAVFMDKDCPDLHHYHYQRYSEVQSGELKVESDRVVRLGKIFVCSKKWYQNFLKRKFILTSCVWESSPYPEKFLRLIAFSREAGIWWSEIKYYDKTLSFLSFSISVVRSELACFLEFSRNSLQNLSWREW